MIEAGRRASSLGRSHMAIWVARPRPRRLPTSQMPKEEVRCQQMPVFTRSGSLRRRSSNNLRNRNRRKPPARPRWTSQTISWQFLRRTSKGRGHLEVSWAIRRSRESRKRWLPRKMKSNSSRRKSYRQNNRTIMRTVLWCAAATESSRSRSSTIRGKR